jgi:N-acetylmuramic acid 6-phosphate etherase
MARSAGGLLPTERPNPASRGIDTRSIRDIVRAINDQDARVAPAVRAQAKAIEAAVKAVSDSWLRGGRLFFVGAGTSVRRILFLGHSWKSY